MTNSHSGFLPGPKAVPTRNRTNPLPRPGVDDGSAFADNEDMDPNQLDLLLSRSIQSAAPLLEPESLEHSMLRNTRVRSPSRSTRRESIRQRFEAAEPTKGDDGLGIALQDEQTETTPLLAPSSATAASSLSSSSRRDDEDDDIEAHRAHETEAGSKTTATDVITTTPITATPFLGGVSPARFWLLFAQIMVGYFVACFDSTIMASSHPVITSHFGASHAASWLSTAFLLTSTSFQPVLGGLSDAVGRRAPYLLTLAIFALGTLWCALARSMGGFIVARAVCGLGAGGMMTLGSIIVSDVVPIEIRGTYQSYINITFGIGSMLGAALGGAMADYLGWRWEFGVQVPLAVACLAVAAIAVPHELGLHGKQRQTLRDAMRTFDLMGSVLMSTSVTFLILGLNLGGNVLPWSHPFVIASLAIFAIFFPLFLFAETRAVKPIMPLHLVLKAPHMNLIISNHIAAFLSSATLFNVPLFFQGVLLTTATASGLRLVALSAVASAAGTATGFLITWTRRLKWPLILGASLLAVGTLCLACMRRGWPAAAYVLCLLPGAAGQGFQFPGTFMAVLAVSEQREQAVVTSTLILWRSLGQVLGVACSSLALQNALWRYLEAYVVAPRPDEKAAIVARVRRSVEAIKDLPAPYREQVVRSYEAALRVTFVGCTLLAVAGLLLLLPVKLPRLGRK